MISYKPFRVLVAERNLKVSDIGKELKLSPNTMAKLNSKTDDGEPISLKNIEKLCKYFDVSIDQIVEII